jgi:hypothetical protein
MKKNIIGGAVLLTAVLILVSGAFGQVITGGYKAVSTDDAGVTGAADFAVSKRAETNSEQEDLALDSIDKAERQVVAGTNYRLCLTVSIGDESQQVQTVVYESLKQEYKLTSWTVADCAPQSANRSKTNDPDRRASGSLQTKKNMPANCAGEQLALKEGESEADIGGKRYGNYVFTNISAKSCKLSGYPLFTVLSRSGKAMRTAAAVYGFVIPGESEKARPRPVTLKSKGTAYFQIYYNDGMALDTKKPTPVSAKVRVRAPNTTRDFVIKSAIDACCGVQVSFIHAGLPFQS